MFRHYSTWLFLILAPLLLAEDAEGGIIYHQSRVQTSLGITDATTLEYTTIFHDTGWQELGALSIVAVNVLPLPDVISPGYVASADGHADFDGHVRIGAHARPAYGPNRLSKSVGAVAYAAHQWRDVIRVGVSNPDPFLAVTLQMSGLWSVNGSWDGLTFAFAPAAFAGDGFELYPDSFFGPPAVQAGIKIPFRQSARRFPLSTLYRLLTPLSSTMVRRFITKMWHRAAVCIGIAHGWSPTRKRMGGISSISWLGLTPRRRMVRLLTTSPIR